MNEDGPNEKNDGVRRCKEAHLLSEYAEMNHSSPPPQFGTGRRCRKCGAHLSTYNHGRTCHACQNGFALKQAKSLEAAMAM